MLVTKEQQESWLDSYIKEGHNFDECVGFMEGIEKALSYMQDKMKPEAINEELDSIRKQQCDLSEICYTC